MGRNYKICPRCGDHLDHGERCECMDRRPETAETARATPTDLARGKDRTAKAYISRV